jgi:uridine phosphorylase
MPARLQPTAPIAERAILVGDPGRALMLAQELLEQPKMSNHARGLWGYTGRTPGGDELSLQSTGMGGPSAALVLSDLAELGLRRAIRIGTCAALAPDLELGQLLTVTEAHAWGGPGIGAEAAVDPDPELAARLRETLGSGARAGSVASLDVLHIDGASAAPAADAADMQTAALLARGPKLGVAVAAALVVTSRRGTDLDDGEIEMAAERAGRAASRALSG